MINDVLKDWEEDKIEYSKPNSLIGIPELYTHACRLGEALGAVTWQAPEMIPTSPSHVFISTRWGAIFVGQYDEKRGFWYCQPATSMIRLVPDVVKWMYIPHLPGVTDGSQKRNDRR